MTTALSRTAASTESGLRRFACTAWIWPTRPSGCKWHGEVGPPHRDADAVAAFGQARDHMAAEKPGAAEDRDQRIEVCLGSCGALALAGAGRASACPEAARLGRIRGRRHAV